MAEYCNDRFLMVEDNEDSFQMWQGLVGPHYTPIVSNDGTLSWTNNGLLPNPDAVNLRGPQGAGLTIAGIRESESALPEETAPGALWLVGTEVPYEGYSYINGAWVDLGPVTVGPAGPPGPQGDDYTLTEADKAEIADAAEVVLLNNLANNPLPINRGGTGAQTLADAQENLGIADLADQIGDTPLATEAQDIRGAINELVGDLGSLDFDTAAQNVTGAVNELEAEKVDKAGDTMTGTLVVENNYPIIVARSDKIETDKTSISSDSYANIAIKDKSDRYVVYLQAEQLASGRVGLTLNLRRYNSGNINHGLKLTITNDGTKAVELDAPSAWRKALALGNASGDFPLTIAQGGSGQQAATTETTIANIVSDATNFTVTSASFVKWGKIAQISIVAKCTTAISSGGSGYNYCTLKTGYRPAIMSTIFDSSANPVTASTNGALTGWRSSVAVDTTVTIRGIFILA